MSAVLGVVESLHRFPVKSMRGERLEHADLGPAGLDGDREWALLDEDRNWVSAKSNKRRWRLYDGMLDLVATTGREGRLAPAAAPDEPVGTSTAAGTAGGGYRSGPTHDDTVTIALPDGRAVQAGTPEADALLSAHLGRTLAFDRGDQGLRWGRHHDAAPLHLLTTATLAALRSDDEDSPERGALDPMRLRPNLVVRTPDGVDGFVEDGWIGATVEVGGAVLRVVETTGRCVMTTRAQGDGLARDTTVLKRIGARNGADAGVYLAVVEPGTVALGDELRVVG